jgi:predicted DNA-binding transcriptional regulator AlpA
MSAALLSAREVAGMFGRSAPWFYERRRVLEKAGFPKKDATLGGWHRLAVEQWLARRAGVVERDQLADEKDAARRAIDEAAARRRGSRNAVRHA